MKNFKNAIFATISVVALTTGSSASAQSIESVLPKAESNNVISITSSHDQFGPVTILDYVQQARTKYNGQVESKVSVNSTSVSNVKDIVNIKDIL